MHASRMALRGRFGSRPLGGTTRDPCPVPDWRRKRAKSSHPRTTLDLRKTLLEGKGTFISTWTNFFLHGDKKCHLQWAKGGRLLIRSTGKRVTESCGLRGCWWTCCANVSLATMLGSVKVLLTVNWSLHPQFNSVKGLEMCLVDSLRCFEHFLSPFTWWYCRRIVNNDGANNDSNTAKLI